MTAFLWAMLLFFALEFIAALYFLNSEVYPTASPRTLTVDATFDAAVAGWVIYLLASRS